MSSSHRSSTVLVPTDGPLRQRPAWFSDATTTGASDPLIPFAAGEPQPRPSSLEPAELRLAALPDLAWAATSVQAADPMPAPLFAAATLAGRGGEIQLQANPVDLVPAPLHFGRCACAACSGAGREVDAATTTSGTATAAPAAAASLGTLASYLTTGFWQEWGYLPFRFNLTSSGIGANSGTLTYNVSGWADDANGLTTDRRALVHEIFKLYSVSLGINFVEVTGSGGDIRFTDNDSGAYAYWGSGWYADASRTSVIADYSVVNIETSWYDGRSNYNTYLPMTVFHEVGHAMGLGHQGQYNYEGTPLSYSTSAQFANDSWQATMMSYWDQVDNPTTGASFAWLHTPMSVDWIALDELYGSQGYGVANAFRGDTVYGVGTNISASVSKIWNEFSLYAGLDAYTIVDGSGYDTLNVSNFSANQLINLAPSEIGSTTPSISSIGGKVGNLTIAAGTIIEAAIGGSGGDMFYGNAAANTFRGNGGNDSFYDSLGSDIYYGDAGIDWLYFSESIDLMSYWLSGDSLLFSRRSGSADVDQVWKGLENISFSGVAYTYDQLLANLTNTPDAPPTATLALANGVSGSIDEGTSLSIDITTTNLPQGSILHWEIYGPGIASQDFDGLDALTGTVATDASGQAVVSLAIAADAVTEGDELMGFAVFSDAARTNRLADLSVTIRDTSLTPAVSDLTLWGTTASDRITGEAGNDRLSGVLATGTSAAAMGRGQIDELTGDLGEDVFVLGDDRGVFYDDRSDGNLGNSDYAKIVDFVQGEDRIQLVGGSYLTVVSKGKLSLYWDRNDTGVLEKRGSSRDELIAVFLDVTTVTANDVVWV